MSRRFMIIVPALAALVLGCATPPNPSPTASIPVAGANNFSNNPFSAPSTMRHGAINFAAIKTEDFKPAMEEGMRLQLIEVAAIADATARPTFENTIVAMERTGQLLDRTTSVFFNLTSSSSTPAIRALQREMGPKLAAHGDAINLNPKLFARVKSVYEARASLSDPVQKRLVERYYRGMVRAGANLTDAQQTRIRAINQEMASLTTSFSQNVLADTNQFALVLETEADRAGLPKFFLDAALEAGRARGMEGKHVVTLSRASVEPFLQLSSNREMRQKAWEGWIKRGDNNDAEDTKAIIARMLALRAERAQLLGYRHHADFVLDDTMAKTPANVADLLNRVWEPALAAVAKDSADYLALAKSQGFTGDKLEPWDWRYYAEKTRQARFSINEDQVKPYFTLDNMLKAQFHVAEQLFGIKLIEITGTVPVYHPDVRVWRVNEADGREIGLFYGDFFSRESKQGGAWMSSFQSQDRLNGDIRPHVVNVLNYTKAPAGQPTLLSYDDAETLFHEFGHALHGLLSNVDYPSLAGTAVSRDFVEFPAQVYEHWLGERAVLEQFARHYQTNEPMPTALLEKVMAARNHDQGFATVEFLSSALVDMDAHSQTSYAANFNINTFEQQSLGRINMPREIVMRHRPTHFGHIFSGGYSAGYYSYMWSEVLDADGFMAFKEAGNIFDPATARRLRENVYAVGNSRDPAASYRAYRGRDPDAAALLRLRGFTGAS